MKYVYNDLCRKKDFFFLGYNFKEQALRLDIFDGARVRDHGDE